MQNYIAKLNDDGTYELFIIEQGVDAITNQPINISVDKGSFTIEGITSEIADFQRAMDDDNVKLTAMQAVPLPEPTPTPVVDTPDAPLSTNSEQ